MRSCAALVLLESFPCEVLVFFKTSFTNPNWSLLHTRRTSHENTTRLTSTLPPSLIWYIATVTLYYPSGMGAGVQRRGGSPASGFALWICNTFHHKTSIPEFLGRATMYGACLQKATWPKAFLTHTVALCNQAPW
jgi:hypothetical protein